MYSTIHKRPLTGQQQKQATLLMLVSCLCSAPFIRYSRLVIASVLNVTQRAPNNGNVFLFSFLNKQQKKKLLKSNIRRMM